MKRLTLNCGVCSAPFRRYPSQIKPGGTYCSDACARKVRRGAVLHCDLCDGEFYRHPSEIARTEKRFCSRACHMAWRAINRSPDTYPKIGPVHEHRLVAERVLGRALRPGEVVHHIDEDKQNREPENLAVFPDQATHARCHGGGMPAAELDRYRLVALAKEAA